MEFKVVQMPETLEKEVYPNDFVQQILSGYKLVKSNDNDQGFAPIALQADDYRNISFAILAEKDFESIMDSCKNLIDSLEGDEKLKAQNNAKELLENILLANHNEETIANFLDNLDKHEENVKAIYGDSGNESFKRVAQEVRKRNENIKKIIESSSAAKSAETVPEIDIESLFSEKFKKNISDKEIRDYAGKIAEDMKFEDQIQFMKINPSEFHNQNWSKEKTKHLSPNVLTTTKSFNDLSNKVQSDILLANSIEQQQNIYKFYIYTMQALVDKKDLSSAVAILTGINRSAVYRLNLSQNNQELTDIIEKVNKISSPGGSYNAMREFERQSDSPLVPFIGGKLTDLTFTDDGNPNKLEINDQVELQNVTKFALIGKIISDVDKFQMDTEATFSKKVPVIHSNFSKHINKLALDDDSAFQISMHIKARGEGEPIKVIDSDEKINQILFKEIKELTNSGNDNTKKILAMSGTLIRRYNEGADKNNANRMTEILELEKIILELKNKIPPKEFKNVESEFETLKKKWALNYNLFIQYVSAEPNHRDALALELARYMRDGGSEARKNIVEYFKMQEGKPGIDLVSAKKTLREAYYKLELDAFKENPTAENYKQIGRLYNVFTNKQKQEVFEIQYKENKKDALSNIIMREFFDPGNNFESSAKFLAHLNKNYDINSDLLTAKTSDDKYGILTLRFDGIEPPLEFRLKRPDAYGGPRTEDYLERLNLRAQAALKFIDDKDGLTQEVKDAAKIEVEKLKNTVVEKMNTKCVVDPLKVIDGNYQGKDYVAHIEQVHKDATDLLGVFDQLVAECVKQKCQEPFNVSKIKRKLYDNERVIMSDLKRPERITMHQVDIRGKKIISVNDVTPVHPKRTVSSAKKDEAGVANYLQDKTALYEINQYGRFVEHDVGTTYRSASIVPHELITKSELGRQLAFEQAKRNILDDVIPSLLKGNTQLEDPIKLNYELLTLLSPISKSLDNILDPDASIFLASREAMNHFSGRTFNVNVDGQKREVQFDAVYHNYGVNVLRGFKQEHATNQKAYNQIIERSFEPLKSSALDASLREFIKNCPQYSPKTADKVKIYTNALHEIYSKMDTEASVLWSNEEQAQLMQFVATQSEELNQRNSVYLDLLTKFDKYQNAVKPLEIEAQKLESKIRDANQLLAEKRQDYFHKNYKNVDKMLAQYENNPNLPDALRTETQHFRTLIEFSEAAKAGHDSLLKRAPFFKDNADKNSKNYQLQSYAQMLCKLTDTTNHITCKSGKDRTNISKLKVVAKNSATILLGRVPKFSESKKYIAQEQKAFESAYIHGSGNDICGDNMKPGAQNISEGDVYTEKANLKIINGLARIQKKMKLSESANELYDQIKTEYKTALSEKPKNSESQEASQNATKRPSAIQHFASHFRSIPDSVNTSLQKAKRTPNKPK